MKHGFAYAFHTNHGRREMYTTVINVSNLLQHSKENA